MALAKDTTPPQSTEEQKKDKNYRESYSLLLHRLEIHVALGYPNFEDAGEPVKTIKGSVEHNLLVIKHQLDKVIDLIFTKDPKAARKDNPETGYASLYSDVIKLSDTEMQLVSDSITLSVGLLLNLPNKIPTGTATTSLHVLDNITLMGCMSSLQLAEVVLHKS